MPYETVEATVIKANLKDDLKRGMSILFYLDTEYNNNPLKTYTELSLEPDRTEQTRQILKSIGFNVDTQDFLDIDKGCLNGKTIPVYFKETEKDGKKKLWCNISIGNRVQVDTDKVLEVQARFRGQPVQKKAVNNDPDDLSIDSEVVPF